MEETPGPGVTVLRLGHRPGRDARVTTHVALVARAFGAIRVVLSEDARGTAETVGDVTDRFGGPFHVETTRNPLGVLRGWDGMTVHLTMYGEPVQSVIGRIRAASHTPVLVVVGAEKVPREVYAAADWNVAVTNQPHSEIAALAVFLDRWFDGRELDRGWDDADQRVVPETDGKTLEPSE